MPVKFTDILQPANLNNPFSLIDGKYVEGNITASNVSASGTATFGGTISSSGALSASAIFVNGSPFSLDSVTTAATASHVLGSNVSGTVSNAETASYVLGGSVQGAVDNATSAGNANTLGASSLAPSDFTLDYVVGEGSTTSTAVTFNGGITGTLTGTSTGLSGSPTIQVTAVTASAGFSGDGANLTGLPSQTDHNFTTALKLKLDNIEASASVDQTGAEIKSALFGEADTNNFTDTLKLKLDNIAESASNYSLPTASHGTLGGVYIGYAENGKNYPVELSSSKMYVNVPWTDTTYSVGDGGLTKNNFTDAFKNKLDAITQSTETSNNVTFASVSSSGGISASAIFVNGAPFQGGETASALSGSPDITVGEVTASSLMIGTSSIDVTTAAKNQVLKFDGTKFRMADIDESFELSIKTFQYTATNELIGTGSWKNPGQLSFTATYNAGPPATASIFETYADPDENVVAWTTPYASTTNSVAINYTSVGGYREFKLVADGLTKYATNAAGTDLSNNNSRIYFYNNYYYGARTETSGYDDDFVTHNLTGTQGNSTSVTDRNINASGDKYLFYAVRTENAPTNKFIWGTSTTEGLSTSQVAISMSKVVNSIVVENSKGYSEHYHIYRSGQTFDQSGYLSINQSVINYVYLGYSSDTSGWSGTDIRQHLGGYKVSTNDFTQTWNEITAPSDGDYILFACPDRGTAPTGFKDATEGFGVDFENPVTVSVENQYGYVENYLVFRSTDPAAGSITLETS